MLKTTEIKKAFHDLKVLKGVDLYVEKGEIISITGKSGSGKSTLLHILGTLDSADAGEISIDNINLTSLSKNELAEFRNKKIGFVFQFHHLLSEFTALENTCMPAYIQKSDKKTIENKASELLDYLGLSERLKHKPSQLSGGEQQRVAVARALINNPKIIFADEPSGNLDQESSDDLHELLFKLRADFQQTFVIVTHNQELAKISDKNYELIDGKLKLTM